MQRDTGDLGGRLVPRRSAPGTFVMVDQFVDRTLRGGRSFFGDGIVAHVGFGHPTCAALGRSGRGSARRARPAAPRRGTMLVIEGPQFSTRAEIVAAPARGFDVVGMTGMPEARLAREAELCYQSVAMVTDLDGGPTPMSSRRRWSGCSARTPPKRRRSSPKSRGAVRPGEGLLGRLRPGAGHRRDHRAGTHGRQLTRAGGWRAGADDRRMTTSTKRPSPRSPIRTIPDSPQARHRVPRHHPPAAQTPAGRRDHRGGWRRCTAGPATKVAGSRRAASSSARRSRSRSAPVRADPQEGQAARRDHRRQVRAGIRHRHDRDPRGPSSPARACCWSTI